MNTQTDDAERTGAVEPAKFREALSRITEAVHIVATDGTAGLAGVTATAFASVTDTPPTILVCINRFARAHAAIERNAAFTVNTLHDAHSDLADIFAGRGPEGMVDRFGQAHWIAMTSGAPGLAGALVVLDCLVADRHEYGSHSVIFGTVAGVRLGGTQRPLSYHRRAYSR